MTATRWERAHDHLGFAPFLVGLHTPGVLLEAWIGFWQSIASGSADETLEQKFRRVADQWKAAVGSISNLDDIRGAAGYAELVALGRPVIPLILNELDSDPFYWFEVLAEITGVDPTPADQAGDVDAMTAAWKAWSRKKRIG
jgi:hypothetical protein